MLYHHHHHMVYFLEIRNLVSLLWVQCHSPNHHFHLVNCLPAFLFHFDPPISNPRGRISDRHLTPPPNLHSRQPRLYWDLVASLAPGGQISPSPLLHHWTPQMCFFGSGRLE